MPEVETIFQIGDVVKVITDITTKDFEGNEIQLPVMYQAILPVLNHSILPGWTG